MGGMCTHDKGASNLERPHAGPLGQALCLQPVCTLCHCLQWKPSKHPSCIIMIYDFAFPRTDGNHLKHLAGAFGIGGGEYRSMHFQEAVRAEEYARFPVKRVAAAHDCCNDPGARPQVRVGPQELHGTTRSSAAEACRDVIL